KTVPRWGLAMDPKGDPRERHRSVEIAALALLGVAAARGLSAYLRQRCINTLARRFVSETRQELLERVTRMPLERHFKIGAGELLHRVLVDTSALRRFVGEVVLQTATNIFRVVFPVALLFLHQAVMAAVVCSVIPVQWLLNLYLQRRAHDAWLQTRKQQS